MGYYTDLGTGVVAGFDGATGYPVDERGHLLDPHDLPDDAVLPIAVGAVLYNTTAPYGHLAFACGSEDDFHCFDWADIDGGDLGRFVALDSVINSETGGFIMDGSYEVLPANTDAEKRAVLRTAFFMVGQACKWLHGDYDDAIEHDADGWNQGYYYFVANLAESLFPGARRLADERFPSADETQWLRDLAYGGDE